MLSCFFESSGPNLYYIVDRNIHVEEKGYGLMGYYWTMVLSYCPIIMFGTHVPESHYFLFVQAELFLKFIVIVTLIFLSSIIE